MVKKNKSVKKKGSKKVLNKSNNNFNRNLLIVVAVLALLFVVAFSFGGEGSDEEGLAQMRGGGSGEDDGMQGAGGGCEYVEFGFTRPESINSKNHNPSILRSKYTELASHFAAKWSIDEIPDTTWSSENNPNSEYLVFDLGAKKCVNRIQVYGKKGGYENYPNKMDLHTWDGKKWVEGFVDWKLTNRGFFKNPEDKSFSSKTQYVKLTFEGTTEFKFKSLADVQFNIADPSNLMDGLIAYYDFEEETTKKNRFLSRTLYGKPIMQRWKGNISFVESFSNIYGRAVRLNQSGDQKDVLRILNNHLKRDPIKNELSIAFWVRTDSETDMTLFKKKTSGRKRTGQPGFQLKINKNKIEWFAGGLGSSENLATYERDFSDWTYVVVTAKIRGDKVVYVNGLERVRVPTGTKGLNARDNLFIGTNLGFTGEIDELLIWNRQVSSKEVAAVYEFWKSIFSYEGESCQDPDDGGYNIYKKGTILSGNSPQPAEDCIGGRVLEYWCNKDGEVVNQLIDCPKGYECSDGACIESKSCQDPDDGGDNIYKKGTILFGDTPQPSEDCIGGKVLEYWCKNDKVTNQLRDCPKGYECSDGACIESKI